jgi:hypothetical protein
MGWLTPRGGEATFVQKANGPIPREREQKAGRSPIAKHEQTSPQRSACSECVETPCVPERERRHPNEEIEELEAEDSARPFDAAIDGSGSHDAQRSPLASIVMLSSTQPTFLSTMPTAKMIIAQPKPWPRLTTIVNAAAARPT